MAQQVPTLEGLIKITEYFHLCCEMCSVSTTPLKLIPFTRDPLYLDENYLLLPSNLLLSLKSNQMECNYCAFMIFYSLS